MKRRGVGQCGGCGGSHDGVVTLRHRRAGISWRREELQYGAEGQAAAFKVRISGGNGGKGILCLRRGRGGV